MKRTKLSGGVRIYNQGLSRDAFSSRDPRWPRQIKNMLAAGLKIKAVGCESGAMVVHFFA